ncbi:MAG: condensation domain-containing protein [Cyanobacteria bacterium J06635_1]
MKLIRALSPIEEGFEACNQIANTLNVVTISKVKGSISKETLEHALKIVEQRHPQLQCCIDGPIGMLGFGKRLEESIPLQVIEAVDSETWQQAALKELNQSLDSSQSLWRITLICHADHNVNHLITTTHHAISDGISTISLHSEILSYCGDIQCESAFPSQIPTLPFLPSPEAMLPHIHRGYRGKVSGVLWLLRTALKQLYFRPKTLSFEKLVPVEERTCNVIYRQIEPVLTRALLKQCRIEKTTVQGALCAAMLLAVSNDMKTSEIKNLSFTCRSFVDLRRRLSPVVGNEDLGSLASAVATFHTITDSTGFWQLARDVKQAIEQSLDRGEMFNIMTMFKELFNDLLVEPNKSPLANKAPLTVEASNVGKIDIPVNYGSLELEEISFMPSQGIFGGVFFAAVATFRDRMIFNFAFSEPSISRATVENLIDDTLSYLEGSYE